ncbi:uncharacterized protein LACBIDRAFT_334477 [Laccaria bicolor S238N-H82]|uniref:Predicted protein n=1 Tax=Laccaria bicolor (strain S238N-H82 / ATCC MYA-4686) TaxID=486041 RepID=B0DZA6_LACBS|nr:uncharacterized protein LACBIDRAFT_334477 [Laccaria bicolor S238N-H82]EDR00083.1 predicted protein [Laccaria bicolor S238N-H82]|eukprot:XP_001889289.1 predicted protein [Laccaria bicolor S238N-H82]
MAVGVLNEFGPVSVTYISINFVDVWVAIPPHQVGLVPFDSDGGKVYRGTQAPLSNAGKDAAYNATSVILDSIAISVLPRHFESLHFDNTFLMKRIQPNHFTEHENVLRCWAWPPAFSYLGMHDPGESGWIFDDFRKWSSAWM